MISMHLDDIYRVLSDRKTLYEARLGSNTNSKVNKVFQLSQKEHLPNSIMHRRQGFHFEQCLHSRLIICEPIWLVLSSDLVAFSRGGSLLPEVLSKLRKLSLLFI